MKKKSPSELSPPPPFWQRVWETDLTRLPAGKALVIRSLRVLYVVKQEASGGNLGIRAQSLVYTALLSFVPLLAVSFSVLKGLGVHARYEIVLYYFLEPLGDPGVELSMRLIGFVENAQAGVVGTLGLAFLFYTVLSMIGKVEKSLNHIWYERKQKAFLQRFATYITLLLAAPLLLAFAVSFAASLRDIPVVHRLLEKPGLAAVLPAFTKVLSVAVVAAVFTFVYAVLPNARVRLKPALTGGIFAGVSWLATGWIFARFVATSARYSAIYSSFATIILFLIWLYWSFLILFFGARVAFYTQFPALHRSIGHGGTLGSFSIEECAAQIMYRVCRNFHEGLPAPNLELMVRELRMPIEIIKDVLVALETRGLIVKVSTSRSDTWLPAREPEGITLAETLNVVRSGRYSARTSVHLPHPVRGLLSELERARMELLESHTMGELIRSDPGNKDVSDEAQPEETPSDAPP